jgi:pyruvate,water dikinase
VVNVGPATKIIKTGHMLKVDGDRGVVSVLDAEASGPHGSDPVAAVPSARDKAKPDVPAARQDDTLEDRQLWTNANSGEVMPDVVTPLTWSVAQRVLDTALGEILKRTGFDLCGAPMAKLIAGRVYFNINTLLGMFNAFRRDEAALRDVCTRMGGRGVSPDLLRALEVPDEDVPGIKLGRLGMLLRAPGLIAWLLGHSPARGELMIAATRRNARKLRRVDVGRLSDSGILDYLMGRTLTLNTESASWLVVQGVGMMHFVGLDAICRRWFGDADGTFARRLVGGLSGVLSAEAGLALWRLAEYASRHDEVAAAIRTETTFEALRRRVARDPAGAEFLARWDRFMDEHGHHTRGELEFANPRWSDTPDEVLAMVRGHLDGVGSASPVARQARLAADRRRLTKECRSRLCNPIKRIVFDHLLKRAQLGCRVRENMKSEGVKLFSELRRMLLELGRRLVARGVLRRIDDIFFLDGEEIEPVVHGNASFDVRRTIADRRSAHERNLAITPPAVVVGRFDPDNFVPDAVDLSATRFEGIASSPGVVTGPARVVTRTGEDTVRPGEILVAPFTDPGWTPYFVNAAGIVMDMGGLLSHGSIIAREYGLPAVVNVGPATKTIRTGQLVEVDGDRGRVRILGEAGREPKRRARARSAERRASLV